MDIQNIEKYSFKFFLLKSYVTFWHNKVFYKRVVYINRELVPLNEHLIFTPNHQNALMDALAVEFSFKNQFVFAARSDIFRKKFIANLLYFLKILPVYRIRDGFDSLKKNQKIFRKIMDVIQNKNGFVIMPEGDHSGFRRLRPLRKGFARVAFQAEEASNYSLKIKIVPVGVNFSKYESYRSEVLVVFGEPISVSEYYEVYNENQALAYNTLKSKLAEKLKPLMIEIENINDYDVYYGISHIYQSRACTALNLNPKNLYDNFKAQKKIISALNQFETEQPGKILDFARKIRRFLTNLKVLKFGYKEIESGKANPFLIFIRILVLILTFPLFVYGYLNNILPYYIPIFVSNKIKDIQFHSSIKFTLSLFLFPIFYLMQGSLMYWILPTGWLFWAYMAGLPISAAIAWNYTKFYKKTLKQFRFFKYKATNNKVFVETRKLHKEILSEMEKLFSVYLTSGAKEK